MLAGPKAVADVTVRGERVEPWDAHEAVSALLDRPSERVKRIEGTRRTLEHAICDHQIEPGINGQIAEQRMTCPGCADRTSDAKSFPPAIPESVEPHACPGANSKHTTGSRQPRDVTVDCRHQCQRRSFLGGGRVRFVERQDRLGDIYPVRIVESLPSGRRVEKQQTAV